MPKRTCHHILANGALCQAEPLRNRDYCRFHLQQIGRRMNAARTRACRRSPALKLPLLEDLPSVQIALMQLADAIAHREIEPQHARLLTTVLRLAMHNLKSTQAWQFADKQENAVAEWTTFEQEHGLPEDLDLSQDPEAVFPPDENTTGAPLNPGVGLSANDDPLREKIRRALGEAEEYVTRVTADNVELMETYEREGREAAEKFSNQMVRNDRRRERMMQRARYAELARHHNIQLAAHKLFEDALRTGLLKPQMTVQEAWQSIRAMNQKTDRKPPLRETAAPSEEPAAVEA